MQVLLNVFPVRGASKFLNCFIEIIFWLNLCLFKDCRLCCLVSEVSCSVSNFFLKLPLPVLFIIDSGGLENYKRILFFFLASTCVLSKIVGLVVSPWILMVLSEGDLNF